MKLLKITTKDQNARKIVLIPFNKFELSINCVCNNIRLQHTVESVQRKITVVMNS